jgi:hypothetical protein
MEVCSVYKQVLANTTINDFFQAVLFAQIFLGRLLRHTLCHDGIDYGDYIEQLTYG